MSQHENGRSAVADSSVCSDEVIEVLGRAFAAVVSEIDTLTHDRPEIREAIHVLAHGMAEATRPQTAEQGESAAPERQPPSLVLAAQSCETLSADPGPASFRPATQTGTVKLRYSDVTDADLDIIIERTRLKAEGSRWAVEREERQREGEDFASQIRPGDQDIIHRAKSLPHCFLWMNQPRGDAWRRADDFLLIADCFDTLAESLVTLQATLQSDCRESFRKAIDLVAEAQSALRIAVSRVEQHPDSDQQMVYHWLRNRAGIERFYIERYMRITDPADPERCDDVADESVALRESLSSTDEPQIDRTRLLGKARYHLNRLTHEDEAFDRGEWERVVDAVEQLVGDGLSPDDVELRDVLGPYRSRIPSMEFSPEFQSVLDGIDRHHADGGQVDAA